MKNKNYIAMTIDNWREEKEKEKLSGKISF